MNGFPDLPSIVAHGLCAGCGLCESLAGADRVEMAVTSAGQIRPKVKAKLDDPTMARIRAACPGITLIGPAPEQAGAHGTMHPIWGPIRTLHRGWAADDAVRYRAAAGGAMTALGCYLLESGQVDAVVHVRASATQPMLTDAAVSRTVDEVIAGAQSRYGPAAPLRHVMRLLDEGVRFAVLAKPCDVGAIRNLGRIDGRVATQVPYLITMFCGGVPTVHTARRIAAYHGVPEDEIALFRWRGNGWPGPTRVATKDGRVFDLSYDFVWHRDDVPWTYDMQFRCKICPDAIGELGDVSCPDGWVMEDGQPVHREAPGVDIVIARTAAGERLVAAAAAAGALEIEPFTIAELDAMHADHKPRKMEWPARVRALGAEGEPAPRYDNFRAGDMSALLGAEADGEAEAGARRRVRNGAHREPLD
ncbi:MAG: Coenzyme F420 hydrogenase/dehydrogenase, beta subunit C-terminal domain [Alphaproteobacteria bacterium]